MTIGGSWLALDKQLSKLNEPIVRAQRPLIADGMVSEIDTLISQRQALEFLKLGPSILNPLLWGTTLESTIGFVTLSKETADVLSSNYFQEQFSNRLISILLISFSVCSLFGSISIS